MKRISIPGEVFWGSATEFRDVSLQELTGKKVLLLMTSSAVSRLSLNNWMSELKQKAHLTWVQQIPPNPTHIDVYSKLCQIKGFLPDVVFAIGGGSTIDLAKCCVGLNYLATMEQFSAEDVRQAIRTKEYLNYPVLIPIYACPTTAGTGSEVTQWATVWDGEGTAKYSIEAPHLCPKRAYIVPEYTISMPRRLTLSTGLDAFCQAIEAYWAKASNPMVKEISKAALRLLVQYLPLALSEPSELYFREKVCLGSLFSGLAFSNTRTTACHSISYPLTMRFGIEHGLACALTLSEVMKINLPAISGAEELLEVLMVKSADELREWLERISSGIVKLRLSSFGIRKGDLSELARMSFTLGRMDNNPVELTQEKVRKILESIL
jgi:alcohol dehydrogenase class IV